MAKKQTTLKGLGPRYGIKIRKQFTQVHHLMKQKRKCPECGGPVIREAVGTVSYTHLTLPTKRIV